MKKLLGILLSLSLFIFSYQPVCAVETVDCGGIELIKGYATAYYLTGQTATGVDVRDGICAGCKAYMGKTILIYQRLPGDELGDLIGIYECLDTGGSDGIKKGKVIDVWCDGLDACQDFMDIVWSDGCRGKVFIQVTDAVG